MTAVRTAALLVCLACPVAAEDWVALTGPEITQALTSRVLGYPDGTLQDFKAGGQTIAGSAEGRWRVQGDQYCSVWPPSERWDCYGVARSVRGLDIGFTGGDGSVTVGRYVDLQ
jgi:hypothetical protein